MTTKTRVRGVTRRAQMIEIGKPFVIRIGPVVARLRVDGCQYRRVKRIGRHRDEHFIALVNERVQREIDAFGSTGGNEDPVR